MSFSYRHDDDEPSYTYNITGVAISNKSILILSTFGFGLLGFALYYLILRRTTDDHDEQEENTQRDVYGEMLDQSDVATLNRAQRRARAKFRMKKARRAVAPGQRAEGVDGGDGGVAPREGVDAGVNNNDFAETNLSRKERQRVAKAMEQKERKVYAEEARKWRENNQSTMKTEGIGRCSDGEENITERPNKESELSLDPIFPRRENENDILSETLFRESITKNIQDNANSYDERKSKYQEIAKMTIREFIERLKQNGSVSVVALADEFGITVKQALFELENINKQHGIVGLVDADGEFVYVSMEMIKLAIKLGRDAGKVSSPDNTWWSKNDGRAA